MVDTHQNCKLVEKFKFKIIRQEKHIAVPKYDYYSNT